MDYSGYNVDGQSLEDCLGEGADADKARAAFGGFLAQLLESGAGKHDCHETEKGQWEIRIAVGQRWAVLGYEIGEADQTIFLRYCRWDRTRRALAVLRGLLENYPGR